jgi:hypothetical protein
MDNSNATPHGEELPQHVLEALHKLAHAGASHGVISLALGLKPEVVRQVLSKHPSQIAKKAEPTFPVTDADEPPTMSSERVMLSTKKKAKISEICKESSTNCAQDLQAPQLHEDSTFIYSYEYFLNTLHRTNLVTGEQSSHQVPSYTFNVGCCWSEVLGGSLLVTGGLNRDYRAVREVVRIDTRREFAVSHCPPMLTRRRAHAAVYHTPLLYVLGGNDDSYLRECERYVCVENRWEALSPLPRACSGMSGVVVESSLYALGGYRAAPLDLVQKLSLESLTWELMQFRLPFAGMSIPCFKLRDTEVYLVVNATLCSFTAFEVRPLKTLTKGMMSTGGASYYCRGTLYCSNWEGRVRCYEIGNLSN